MVLQWGTEKREPVYVAQESAIVEALPKLACGLAAAITGRRMRSQIHAYNMSPSFMPIMAHCSARNLITTDDASLGLHRMLQHSLLVLFDIYAICYMLVSLLALKAAHS